MRSLLEHGIQAFKDDIKTTTSKTVNTALYEAQKERIDPQAFETGKDAGNNIATGFRARSVQIQQAIIETSKNATINSKTSIQENGEQIGNNYSNATSKAIINNKNEIKNALQGTITKSNSEIEQITKEKGRFLGQKNIEGIKEGEKQEVNGLINATSKVIETVNNSVDTASASDVGNSIVTEIGTGINNGLWNLSNSMRNLGKEGKKGFNDTFKDLPANANNKISEMSNAMYDRRGDVAWVTGKIGEEGNNSLNNNLKGETSGKNYVDGLVRGLNNNKWLLKSSIEGLATGAVKAFNYVLGIHSPSRVMAEQAKFIPLGVAEGIDATQDKAVGSMKNLVYGMQDVVDGIDYSSITEIPKIPKNAITYVPKQAISTQEVQRSITGTDKGLLNGIMTSAQGSGIKNITIPLIIDGEEFIRKTIQLNDNYNLATNGGGL